MAIPNIASPNHRTKQWHESYIPPPSHMIPSTKMVKIAGAASTFSDTVWVPATLRAAVHTGSERMHAHTTFSQIIEATFVHEHDHIGKRTAKTVAR